MRYSCFNMSTAAFPLHTVSFAVWSWEDSDFLTKRFHVGSSQADTTLDVTDVVVEVVKNSAVRGVGQAVEHLHDRFTHSVKLLRSWTPLCCLRKEQRLKQPSKIHVHNIISIWKSIKTHTFVSAVAPARLFISQSSSCSMILAVRPYSYGR